MTTLVPNKTTHKTAAGLKAFFNIATDWGLNCTEQMNLLGVGNQSTLHKWKNAPDSARENKDLLERISYILGIYMDLQILLPDPSTADAWVKKPNAACLFGGKAPIERMCQGKVVDLFVVRQHLARERGV